LEAACYEFIKLVAVKKAKTWPIPFQKNSCVRAVFCFVLLTIPVVPASNQVLPFMWCKQQKPRQNKSPPGGLSGFVPVNNHLSMQLKTRLKNKC